jgi:hypothetical protein
MTLQPYPQTCERFPQGQWCAAQEPQPGRTGATKTIKLAFDIVGQHTQDVFEDSNQLILWQPPRRGGSRAVDTRRLSLLMSIAVRASLLDDEGMKEWLGMCLYYRYYRYYHYYRPVAITARYTPSGPTQEGQFLVASVSPGEWGTFKSMDAMLEYPESKTGPASEGFVYSACTRGWQLWARAGAGGSGSGLYQSHAAGDPMVPGKGRPTKDDTMAVIVVGLIDAAPLVPGPETSDIGLGTVVVEVTLEFLESPHPSWRAWVKYPRGSSAATASCHSCNAGQTNRSTPALRPR